MNGRGTDCTDFARLQTPSLVSFTPINAEQAEKEQTGTRLNALRNLWKMVLQERIELSTSPLPRVISKSVFAVSCSALTVVAGFACTRFAHYVPNVPHPFWRKK